MLHAARSSQRQILQVRSSDDVSTENLPRTLSKDVMIPRIIFFCRLLWQVVPAQRWDIEAYYAPDASRNLTMDVRLAAFMHGFDSFDAASFRSVRGTQVESCS